MGSEVHDHTEELPPRLFVVAAEETDLAVIAQEVPAVLVLVGYDVPPLHQSLFHTTGEVVGPALLSLLTRDAIDYEYAERFPLFPRRRAGVSEELWKSIWPTFRLDRYNIESCIPHASCLPAARLVVRNPGSGEGEVHQCVLSMSILVSVVVVFYVLISLVARDPRRERAAGVLFHIHMHNSERG